MYTTPITLSTMAALLEIKDTTPYSRTDGTFAWILLKATVVGKSESQLILGDVKSHQDLFMLWLALTAKDRREDPKKTWITSRAKNEELRKEFRNSIIASGVIDRKGEATSWESKWFGVKTPEGMESFMQGELMAAIRAYFREPAHPRPIIPPT